MNTTSFSPSTLKHLAETIQDIKIAMLTTVDSKGALHSRPMVAQRTIPFNFDGQLWFFSKRESLKVHDIENCQHVNLTYTDTIRNHYVSVSGKASVYEEKEKIKEYWNPILEEWFAGPEDPELALICVEVQDVQSWDGPQRKLFQLYEKARHLFNRNTLSTEGPKNNTQIDRLN